MSAAHQIGADEQARLKSNLARVFATLLDGAWHNGGELAEVGGSAWDSRVRDLRTERCGSQRVLVRRSAGALREYMLDLSGLTEEWRTRILAGDLGKIDTSALCRCPRCGGSGKVRADALDSMLDGLMQLVERASASGLPIPSTVLDLELFLDGALHEHQDE